MSLRDAQNAVKEFMIKAGQDTPSKPFIPGLVIQDLRINLHEEEAVTELQIAFDEENLVDVADSIADSLVVILGTAVACGLDIEPIFNEVMRSNMTKFIDGHQRDDGKWVKGPSYEPANLAPLVQAQAGLKPT